MARIRSISTIIILCWLATTFTLVVAEEAVTDVLDADPLVDRNDDDDEVISLDDDNILGKESTVTSNLTSSKDGTDERMEQLSNNSQPEIVVPNSLEALSDEELLAICTERGFEISIEGEEEQGLSKMTHADYVEAATKCLSLEKEMQAVLAENPDLAAELEVEIERMRLEKERLEKERDAMLAEKAMLEDQLRKAGVDPSTIAAPVPRSSSNSSSATVDEVLRESFVQLFDRVGSDLQMVGGLLSYVLKPLGGPIQLLWRSMSPSVEGIIRQLITFTHGVVSAQQLDTVRRILLLRYRMAVKFAAPILTPTVALMTSMLRWMNQKKEIQQVRRILGAFLGPLTESLLSGWKIVEPNITSAVTSTRSWLQRVADDPLTQANASKDKKYIATKNS